MRLARWVKGFLLCKPTGSRTLGVTNLYERVNQGMLELTVVSTLGSGEEGGNGTFVPNASQAR